MPETPEPTPPDFAKLWADWLSQSERQWNGIFNDMMATEQFSRSLGSMMDFYLAMQKTLGEQMGRHLNSLNMPSRGDILALNDRLLEIENRLAKIEAMLLAQSRARDGGADGASRPARTRQPASNPEG